MLIIKAKATVYNPIEKESKKGIRYINFLIKQDKTKIYCNTFETVPLSSGDVIVCELSKLSVKGQYISVLASNIEIKQKAPVKERRYNDFVDDTEKEEDIYPSSVPF